MRRAAHLLKSATSEGRKSNKEMLPSPVFRMACSGYIVVEAHGAEGCVAHAQESRRSRQNRHSSPSSRVNILLDTGLGFFCRSSCLCAARCRRAVASYVASCRSDRRRLLSTSTHGELTFTHHTCCACCPAAPHITRLLFHCNVHARADIFRKPTPA